MDQQLLLYKQQHYTTKGSIINLFIYLTLICIVRYSANWCPYESLLISFHNIIVFVLQVVGKDCLGLRSRRERGSCGRRHGRIRSTHRTPHPWPQTTTMLHSKRNT